MKICAVVVTFNRKKLLAECLTALQNQTRKLDSIIVIDNASNDGTDEMIKNNFKGIIYKKLAENTGGAGGFYEGLKIAYKAGFDWIWGMDDDAIADLNACKNHVLAVKKCSYKKSIFCSNFTDDCKFKDRILEVPSLTFVGFFISKYAISDVGLPRNDFFIYHDDSEYSDRFLKKGFKILRVCNSVINHPTASTFEFYEGSFLGKKIRFPKMADWKVYYFVRNSILRNSYKDINKYAEIFNLLKVFLVVATLNRKQSKVYMQGFLDGLLGKSGIRFRPTINPSSKENSFKKS
ncbi:MAG: glycosyltransferase family 2 protein [Patescibacteria group bacterium]|nr:glycosyltransferase family 2 protein [Patescibacteria group bacterium]